MTPTIFCDYAGTIDFSEQDELLTTLREFKNEGARIFLATDGDRDDGKFYLESLADRGYNFFDGVISNEKFGLKGNGSYWPRALEHFKVGANAIILLDDNPMILENASRNNIRSVNSKLQLPMDTYAAQVPAVIEKLKTVYQEVSFL